jgi:hypothetical protein
VLDLVHCQDRLELIRCQDWLGCRLSLPSQPNCRVFCFP